MPRASLPQIRQMLVVEAKACSDGGMTSSGSLVALSNVADAPRGRNKRRTHLRLNRAVMLVGSMLAVFAVALEMPGLAQAGHLQLWNKSCLATVRRLAALASTITGQSFLPDAVVRRLSSRSVRSSRHVDDFGIEYTISAIGILLTAVWRGQLEP